MYNIRGDTMVQVGKQAPDFKASGYLKGKFISTSLSEYLGKWVLITFYPGDFDAVCATEMSIIAANYATYTKLGAEILSVSSDTTAVHKVWNETELSSILKGGIPFPMLSDPSGIIGTAYGVYNRESGMEMRGRFIIDPDSIVQAFEVLPISMGRNILEGLRQIQGLKLIRDSKNSRVLPACWNPGDPSLSAGPELIGKTGNSWKLPPGTQA